MRELRNYVERCLVFRQPLPLEGAATATAPASFGEARHRAIDNFERHYLEQLLAAHAGKIAAAAQAAVVGRAHLYRLLHKHGLGPGS